MKLRVGLFSCIIFFSCLAMDEHENNRITKIQEQTWPLRNDLRILKNIVAAQKCKITKEQQERYHCLNGMVAQHLDNVLRQLDHVQAALSAKKVIHINHYYGKAEEHLKQAQTDLQEYKRLIKEKTNIDVDSLAKL